MLQFPRHDTLAPQAVTRGAVEYEPIPKLADILNVFISRSANVVTVLAVLWLVSTGLPRSQYVEFGFWWGMGIMVGGLLLGGLSSALTRTVMTRGSLPDAIAHPWRSLRGRSARVVAVVIVATAVALGWVATRRASAPSAAANLLLACFLGILFQLNGALASIVRALEIRRQLVWMCAWQMLLVPSGLVIALLAVRGSATSITALAGIGGGYVFAFIASLTSIRRCLVNFGRTTGLREVFIAARRDVVVFTLVNFFAYALLNGDFALVRYIGDSQTVETVGGTKIFFERCVLPVWLIMASAASLQVLRSTRPAGSHTLRLSLSTGSSARLALFATLAALGSTGAYVVYSRWIIAGRGAADSVLVLLAALGYVFNGFVATLLDLFVLRTPVRAVIVFFAVALALLGAQQSLLIRFFGIPGWSVGWLFANGLLATALIYLCSRLSVKPASQRARGADY